MPGHTGDVNPEASVIARWLAAGDSGDFDAFDDLLSVDVVVHAPAGLSTTSRRAEVAVWRAAREAMPDLRHEIQEVLAGVDVEMARVVISGTLTRDFGGVEARGQSVRLDQAVIAHLQDGMVREAWEIVDLTALSHL